MHIQNVIFHDLVRITEHKTQTRTKQDVIKNTNNRTRTKHEPGQITKKNNRIG